MANDPGGRKAEIVGEELRLTVKRFPAEPHSEFLQVIETVRYRAVAIEAVQEHANAGARRGLIHGPMQIEIRSAGGFVKMVMNAAEILHGAELIRSNEVRFKAARRENVFDIFALVDMAKVLFGKGRENQGKGVNGRRVDLFLADAFRDTGDGGRIQTAAEGRPYRKSASHAIAHGANEALLECLCILGVRFQFEFPAGIERPIFMGTYLFAGDRYGRGGRQAPDILIEGDRAIVENIAQIIEDAQLV